MVSQDNRAAANNESQEPNKLAVPAATQTAGTREARLSRVIDYQVSSLQKNDPLEANLGSINSGLMRVALGLDEIIERAMESGPPNVERIFRILPAIDAHLRVTRQVDRFAQIELRASTARKQKPADKKAKRPRLDSPADPPGGQSEDSGI